MNFWLPVFTLWQRDLIRFWREKARVAGFVGSPLVFWFLIGSGFGNLKFFFPGALVLTVMFSAVFSTMSLIEDRREGFLLSMLVSPAPRSSMVLGKILGSSTLAWLQGLMFLCFAPAAGFTPGAAGLAAAAGVVFLVSFAFTVLGFLLAWQMDSTQGFHAIMNLVLFPLWLVSGALFPMASAHGWVQWLMRANPMTYMVSALRQTLQQEATGGGAPQMATSLLVMAGCAAALFVASTLVAGRRTTRNFA
jgi:ABC-2 type transport system permease protein